MKKQFTIFLVALFALGLFPINFSSAADLTTKLKGRILLQVENHGEAWYVEPKTGERFYMANGDEAYNIMRNLGVGVTNKDLERIKTDKNFAKKHSGKIFLQVEDKGQAYYVDFSGNLHYLKNGSEAYGVMKNLGLGITSSNLEKISISQKSNLSTVGKINEINTLSQIVCAADTWSCDTWSECSAIGQQTRICRLTYDCPNISTPSWATTQNCTPTISNPTQTTPAEKNYYIQAKSRCNMLFDVYESYGAWLQDTSDQFRSAVLTLSGYSTGGLYSEVRDAAIKLANSNITIISDQQINNKQWISYWDNALEILNKDPEGFISKATYDLIKTPDRLTTEIEGIKKSINISLNSVLDSLRYH